MSRAAAQILGQQTLAGDRAKDRGNDRGREWAKQAAIVVAASLFVALCARVSVPLPFTPVPLTLQTSEFLPWACCSARGAGLPRLRST